MWKILLSFPHFWHNFTLNMRLCKQDWALWPSVVLLSKGLHLLLSWWHTHPVPRSFFFGAHPPEHALPRPARNSSKLRNGPPHLKHPWLKPIHLLEEIYFRSHPPLEHCSQGSGEVLMLFQQRPVRAAMEYLREHSNLISEEEAFKNSIASSKPISVKAVQWSFPRFLLE